MFVSYGYESFPLECLFLMVRKYYIKIKSNNSALPDTGVRLVTLPCERMIPMDAFRVSVTAILLTAQAPRNSMPTAWTLTLPLVGYIK